MPEIHLMSKNTKIATYAHDKASSRNKGAGGMPGWVVIVLLSVVVVVVVLVLVVVVVVALWFLLF